MSGMQPAAVRPDRADAVAVVVRPRVEADRAAVLAALTECAAATGYLGGPDGTLVPDAEDHVYDPRFTSAWVAELDGVIVGHVAVMPMRLGKDPAAEDIWMAATGRPADDHLLVKRLFVAPGAQRRGVADRLLDTAVAAARAAGQVAVLDTAAVAVPALAMYRSRGWHEVGRAAAHWAGDEFGIVLFVQPGALAAGATGAALAAGAPGTTGAAGTPGPTGVPGGS
ncbi:GNAT family N-acetyltransferase [Nakamurella sp. DB0629]|uniref:GNAT family N-acetyltransferase n=2 Tax=Nakamurella aerolata TaxID=1656892 RepID=A0A849AEL9_9ACTN|nr:GNAT family N-acetyltransferase [Nakamurella aerolata]